MINNIQHATARLRPPPGYTAFLGLRSIIESLRFIRVDVEHSFDVQDFRFEVEANGHGIILVTQQIRTLGEDDILKSGWPGEPTVFEVDE